ncbi:2143_t:CDS:10 [Entrophospora sp. SA101]|nr:2143_t:CDS:10 [Entrophospora sp. SA101]
MSKSYLKQTNNELRTSKSANISQIEIILEDHEKTRISRNLITLSISRPTPPTINDLNTDIPTANIYYPISPTNNNLAPINNHDIDDNDDNHKMFLDYFYSPLTEDQEKLIQSYSDSNILYDKVIEKFNMTVTYHDIKTLNPTVWVNDQVMNFYGKLIVDRNSKNKNLPSLFIHSTQFMTKYSSCGYKAVSKWTKKVDIFEKDLLFIPVHSRNMHWSLCLVDFKASKIYYIDSLYLTSEKYKEDVRLVINNIKEYLKYEWADKKHTSRKFDMFQSNLSFMGVPQQKNSYDCGIFALLFIEHYSRRAPLLFNQLHIPYFRKKIIYEIANGKLLQ